MEPGRVLSERYELVERLGSGGMAEVFVATDRLLGRQVAVKVLLPRRAGDDDLVRRFRREARSAASLNHRNVVSVHDSGSDGDVHFIVMELVDGPTLETVIAERGPLSIDEVVDVTRDVCRALEAAHAAGLVHRDIKPSNIMFDAAGDVKVTDFGIALAIAATRLTGTSDVYGSAPFLAPEQARGGDVDRRADVYALGCVAYAMLTGRPPFTGSEPLSIVYQHLHGELEPPSAHRDGIPGGLDAVVLRMLARDPDDRYASARDVLDELDRVAVGDAPEAAGAGIVATRRLPPDETVPMARDETVPLAGAGAGPTSAAARDGGARPDRGGRAVSRTGLAVVAALVLLAALLAATLLRPEPAADPGPAATTPATDTAPSPPPSPPPPATVEEAVFGLFGVVDIGRQQGGISRKAAEELRKVGEETLDKFQAGETEEASEKLDEGRRKLEKLTREGEVEQDQAEAVLAAMDEIERALGREAPPPGDEDDEGRGDGNGNGNGNGRGQGGDD